jgi:hypothetical protein
MHRYDPNLDDPNLDATTPIWTRQFGRDRLLRRTWVNLLSLHPSTSGQLPSEGPLTGEPYARNSPVRFGGRGGVLLASADYTGTIHIWDRLNSTPMHSLQTDTPADLFGLAFDSRGDRLAWASRTTLGTFDLRSGRTNTIPIEGDKGFFVGISFSPDNQEIIFGGSTNPDRRLPMAALLLAATNRPLWRYTQCRELFKCPADRGYDHRPYESWNSKNQFADFGTSYRYNYNPWTKTLLPLADEIKGLVGETGELDSGTFPPRADLRAGRSSVAGRRRQLLFSPVALPRRLGNNSLSQESIKEGCCTRTFH